MTPQKLLKLLLKVKLEELDRARTVIRSDYYWNRRKELTIAIQKLQDGNYT